MFPRRAVDSVVGIGGMLIALVVGEILQQTGGYVPIFVIADSGYLVALTMIHLLAPTILPAAV